MRLASGEELPPNVLMRFGLSDIRNYDSVELARSLRWFAPLYEPGGGISSRSEITWQRVAAQSRASYVSQGCMRSWRLRRRRTGPSRGSRRSEGSGLSGSMGCPGPAPSRREAGSRSCETTAGLEFASNPNDAEQPGRRETFDPGWTALIDGKAVKLRQNSGVFLQIDVPSGDHHVILKYDPIGGQSRPCALSFIMHFRDSGVDRNSNVLDSWNNDERGLGRS